MCRQAVKGALAHSLRAHNKAPRGEYTLKPYPHLKRGSASFDTPSALGGLVLSRLTSP